MKNKTKLRQSFDYMVLGGIATTATNTFASGALMTAYALILGAGNFFIGVLNGVQSFGNIMHLGAAWLIEKGYSPKKISLWVSFISKPFFFLTACTAFFADTKIALPLMLVSYMIAYLIGSLAGGSFLPWMKALVPAQLVGRFLGVRLKYITLTKVICFSLTSYILGLVKRLYPTYEIYAYSAFLVMATLVGLLAAASFFYMDDREIQLETDKKFLHKIKMAISDKKFRKLILSLSSLSFSNNLMMPFLTVFLLKYFLLPMWQVLIFTLINQLVDSFILKSWGRISDKRGVEYVLIRAAQISIACAGAFAVLSWIYPTNTYVLYGTLAVIYIILGVATSGLNLGINGSAMLYSPKKMAAVYLSTNSSCKFLAAALGAVFAGVLLTICEQFEHAIAAYFLPFHSSQGWFSFFCFCCIMFIVSIQIVRHMKKTVGKVPV